MVGSGVGAGVHASTPFRAITTTGLACIELDPSTHNLATQKMRWKIPYPGSGYGNYTEREILDK